MPNLRRHHIPHRRIGKEIHRVDRLPGKLRRCRLKADAMFGTITALNRSKHLPELEHFTQQLHKYLLTKYIEEHFSGANIRDMKPLAIDI